MIVLTKINGIPFVLNGDLIETIIANPDTTIRMTNNSVYIVKETMEQVVEKIVEYRKRCCQGYFYGENKDV